MFFSWSARARVRFCFGATIFFFAVAVVIALTNGGAAIVIPLLFAVGMLVRALVERARIKRQPPRDIADA